MNPVMTRLGEEHKRLARLLDLFEKLLDQFNQGAEPDYELMDEMLAYMDSYADVVHHPTEDLVFERVLAKPGPKHEAFEILMRQHEAVSKLSRRFRESLEAILNEEVLLRDEVEIQGREMIAALRNHIRLEDSEAFPIALEALSDQDWEEIAEQAPQADDPLFGAADPVRFRNLCRWLCAEADAQPIG